MQSEQPIIHPPQSEQSIKPKVVLYKSINWNAKEQKQIKSHTAIDFEIFHIHKTFDYQTHTAIPTLVEVTFPYLLQLHLNNMGLVSIETINRLQAPELSYLTLSSNNITNIRSLRKTYFPKLTKLSLYTNKIVDWSPIPELFTLKTCQVQIDRKNHSLFSRARSHREQLNIIYPVVKMSHNFRPFIDHKHNDTLKRSFLKILKDREPK